jgi:hypothetical protein
VKKKLQTKKMAGDNLPDPPDELFLSWDRLMSPGLDSAAVALTFRGLWDEAGAHVDTPVRIGIYKLIEVRTVVNESTYRTRPVREADFSKDADDAD